MKKSGVSIFPIPLKDRSEGPFSLFWLWAGGNVLLVVFMSGSSYSPSIGLVPTIVLTIFANLAAYTLCAWSSQRSAKYGIDEMISLRPTFGHNGSKFGVIVLLGINFGWCGILAAMTGSASQEVMNTLTGGMSFTGDYTVYALSAIVIPLVLIMLDPKYGFKLATVTVPLLLILTIYMLINLIQPHYWNQMLSHKPTKNLGWAYVLEIYIAFAVAWQPYLGSWNKFAKTQKNAFWATYLGLASVGILFGLVGGMATLLTGAIDPSVWAGRLDMGLVALFVLIFGTITSIALLLYAAIMAVLSVFPNWNYRVVAVFVALPATVFIYVNSLQDLFNLILAFVGLLAGPYWAVVLADFFFLRKRKINIRACYDPKGEYQYFHGVNIVAVGAQLIGMIVWIYFGGWTTGIETVTFASGRSIFQLVSATLPSMIVSGFVYVVAARYIYSKYQYGGYEFNKSKELNQLQNQQEVK